MKTSIHAVLVACLLSAGAAFAQIGGVVVQNIAEQEVEVKLPDGKTVKKRQPVDRATPGSEVIYTTRFTNQGKAPADKIVISNPLPENTIYVAGSAFGDNTTISFSLDGKTYNSADKLKIKLPDGKERTAVPSEYAHIRWVYNGTLAPGKTSDAGFRVTVK